MGQNQDIACSVVLYSWEISILEVKSKTLTIKLDQHEAIIGMKRGSDTIYTVIDRLLDRDSVYSIIDGRLNSLETSVKNLQNSIVLLNEAVAELSEVMKDGNVK